MKFATVCQLALATLAVAAPTPEDWVQNGPTAADLAFFEKAAVKARASGLTDADILNFALTLEHLEKRFYMDGLETFSEADFMKAGYSPRLRFNIREIANDEATHVSALEAALAAAGYPAVPKCKYDFGLSDVQSFMKVAGILEGVGVTAYLGAAHLISNAAYVTAAGSILTIEARHSAYIRDNQMPTEAPFPYAFDVPQTPMQVFTLASEFITSCPKAANLGITAFPHLNPVTAQMPVRAGKSVDFTVAPGLTLQKGKVFAYYNGNGGPVSADLTVTGSNSVTIVTPMGVAGQSYVILSSESNPAMVSDANTLAGPAIVAIQAPYTYGGFPM